MPELLKEVPDPANRYELELYWLDRWNSSRIRTLIDAVEAWGKTNNAPLICNEFGVLRQAAEPASRNACATTVMPTV